MPFADTITLLAGQWTPITDGPMTVIRVDPRGGQEVELQATVGAVPPGVNSPGSQIIGTACFIRLSEIFCGVPGANRVYARAAISMSVGVNHD